MTVVCSPHPTPSPVVSLRAWRELASDRNRCPRLQAVLTTLRGIMAANDDAAPFFGCEVPLAAIEKLMQSAGLDSPFSFTLSWDGCIPADGEAPARQERIIAKQPFFEWSGWQECLPNDRTRFLQTLDRWIAVLDGFAASFTTDDQASAATGGSVDLQSQDTAGESSDVAGGGDDTQDAAHGDDFRCVRWCGQVYEFTAMQAACVKVLWEHWKRGTPIVGQEYILEAANASSGRLRDVFDKGNHAAWDTMIIEARRGAFRLQRVATTDGAA
jgi:hypothetical protein